MVIRRKRVIKPEKYLGILNYDNSIRIAIKIDASTIKTTHRVGFSKELQAGEAIIPDRELSKPAKENIEGKVIIRKDLPKEEYEHWFEWHLVDWGGHDHYGYSFYMRERYQREYLEPELLELILMQDGTGTKWVATDSIANQESNYGRIKLAMNLMLSLFGSFEIINDDLTVPLKITKTYEWEILRPGELTPEELENRVWSTIQSISAKGEQKKHHLHFDVLKEAKPDIIGMGMKGFKGYIVFSYPKAGIVVLESLEADNATYILDKNWEAISQMTKREVLRGELHLARLYHTSNWITRIKNFIKNKINKNKAG